MQIVGGLGVGLFIAILLTAWRLSSGPVSLAFLTPYLEAAVNDVQESETRVTIDDTILTWAGWKRTLDIRVINARTFSKSGDEIATFPQISVSLSAKALLRGTIAPRSIEFFGPALLMVRYGDGNYDLGIDSAAEGSAGMIEQLLAVLLLEPDSDRPMSYLSRISVVAAEVTYIDNALGVTWHAPVADAQVRRLATGLHAELNLDLDVGGELAEVSILGEFDKSAERMDFGITVDKINPARFATLSNELESLSALDIPISGTFTVSVTSGGKVEGVGFNLEGDEGYFSFPVPMASKMGLLGWAQRLSVDKFKAAGRFEGDSKSLTLDNLDVHLAKGGALYLPRPMDYALPVVGFNAKGKYLGGDNRLELERLELDLNGPKATIQANIAGLASMASVATIAPATTTPEAPQAPEPGAAPSLSVQLSGAIENVAIDELGHYWPKTIAPLPRAWALENLSGGRASRAEIGIALVSDARGTRIQSLEGKVAAEGLRVDYFSPMPPATGVAGTATFDAQRLDITLLKASRGQGLSLKSGRLSFLGLDKVDQDADFTLEVEGGIPDFLELINSEPFRFADDIGIKPGDAKGYAISTLDLKFPLSRDLNLADIHATATSDLTGATFGKILFERDLTDGELKLTANKNFLTVVGKASLGGVPVVTDWVHDLSEDALFKDKYKIIGDIKSVLHLRDLGIAIPDVIGRYIAGGALANINYTVFGDDTGALSTRIDLGGVALAAPELGWSKARNVPASAGLELKLNGLIPLEITSFDVTAPGLVLRGSAMFRENGDLDVLTLKEAKTGRTSVSGSLVPLAEGSWEASLIGDSFDASILWDDFLGVGRKLPDKGMDETDITLTVAADVRKLWLGENRAINDFIGTVYRQGKVWRKIDIEGRVGESSAMQLRLNTRNNNQRQLEIHSNNAGESLRALNFYDNVLGGDLMLRAQFANIEKDAPIDGRIIVRDYALREAPALAELIGVLSMTVLLDALKGEGLNFDLLDFPFTLKKGVLTIKDARTSGPSLGLTGSGTADLRGKALDVEGTVVPAYAVNAVLGNIPIIGPMLTGPEKGSGIFAATYTMKGQGGNVKIDVNPLSALAPGFIRRLFGDGNEGASKPPTRKQNEPKLKTQ